MSRELPIACPQCGATHGYQVHRLMFGMDDVWASRCGECGFTPESTREEQARKRWNEFPERTATSARIQELEQDLLVKQTENATNIESLGRFAWKVTELETFLAESQAALVKASKDLMDASLEARGLGNPAVPSLELHAAEAGWVSVKDGMPASGATVLACYLNRAGKVRRIRAAWIAAKSAESSLDSDIGIYDENTDTWYDPEDWYEQIDNWDDLTAVCVCEGEVTHWMPLPAPPQAGQQGRAPAAGAERSDEPTDLGVGE